LHDKWLTSALIADRRSRPEQVADMAKPLDKLDFTADDLNEIDRYAVEAGVDLWARSAELMMTRIF
jgi:L-glyceraldehyde 3-phosphate reductase